MWGQLSAVEATDCRLFFPSLYRVVSRYPSTFVLRITLRGSGVDGLRGFPEGVQVAVEGIAELARPHSP